MNINLNINEEACKKHGLTESEALLLCLYNIEDNPSQCRENLIKKGYITTFNIQKEYAVTNDGSNTLSSILLESGSFSNDRDYVSLAKALKEIFPLGKKQGTNYYWTDGISLIVKRLKIFFKKYDLDNSITDEQILEAAKKYVDSFNKDYRFMKLLKYFIFKEKKGDAGEIESESELYTYIENADQPDVAYTQTTIDWDVELR